MTFIPNLISRFNIDFDFIDFSYQLKSIFSKQLIDLKKLEDLFGNDRFFFTGNGRSALYVILKSLNLPPKSNIGVPLYSCTSVFDSIIKADHVPYYVDINLSNYTVDLNDLKRKVDNIDALIVIHTFGYPAALDEIKKITKNKPIIEDCAHAFLSEYKNKKVGTIGDVSFFSLSKYISIAGGMIIVNNYKFFRSISNEIGMLERPSIFSELTHPFIAYLESTLYRRPFYGVISFPIGMFFRNMLDSEKKPKKSFKALRIRENDLKLLLKKINEFPRKMEKQRKVSRFLVQSLKDTGIEVLNESEDILCNYYLFPIRFNDEKERDRAYNLLRSYGVDSAKLFHMTPFLAKSYYGYAGGCPNSEHCSKTLLILPNYHTLTETDLVEVVHAIKKVVDIP